MERFAADSMRAERDAHIKAALKSNVPWTDIATDYGLTTAEIEKIVIDSIPGAQRKGSALIVKPDDPGGKNGKEVGRAEW